MRSILLTLGSLLLVVSSALADNWPRFRGPNGTGTSNDKDIPIEWNDVEGIVWKVPIPGLGNSSPILWEQKLFLQTGSKGDRQLLCLDAASGKTLWSKSIPGVPAKINAMNTMASSTPATDGKRIYVAFWDGKDIAIVAYDFQGTLLWNRKLGPFVSQHGAGASPVVYKEKVYYALDQDGKAFVIALDGKSGETVWQAKREAFRACYSAPIIWEKPGAPAELVVQSTTSIRGYNPDTGDPIWNWVWPDMPLRTVASPVVWNNLIICTSGDGGGDRYMATLKVAAEAFKGGPPLPWATMVWDNKKKEFPYVPTPIVHQDHVYFVNDNGFAGCFDVKTGKQIWYERVANKLFTASPVLIDGKVYAPHESGDVYVFAASPKFQLLAKNSLGEVIRASPAVADNRLFIRGEHHLYCIGKRK